MSHRNVSNKKGAKQIKQFCRIVAVTVNLELKPEKIRWCIHKSQQEYLPIGGIPPACLPIPLVRVCLGVAGVGPVNGGQGSCTLQGIKE